MGVIGEFGLKIRNYKAATIQGYNDGIRDRYDYTEAMFCNSLFYYYMLKHGLQTYKDEYTRDIICLDFGFGLRSYEEEKKHVEKMIRDVQANKDGKYTAAEQEAKLGMLSNLQKKVNDKKDSYKKYTKDEIRNKFYTEGVDIKYPKYNKENDSVTYDTIHYVMLYRNPSKAKTGEVMFINEKLYDVAYNWLTMGIGNNMPVENAKIVEMSAYAPLVTSTIVDTIHMPMFSVLILEDKDSFYNTIANIVRAEVDDNGNKYCKVFTENTEVKNTIWDGMALLDKQMFKEGMNGMMLLRNHFFKACAFNTNIQQFFQDWCEKNGYDYNTYEVKDMFGFPHKLKSIKMITTDNAIKWKKFKDLMGGDMVSAYKYWKQIIRADNYTWGVVKTDHESKLGDVQQMSYQMVNTLPCNQEELRDVAKNSIDYVMSLKLDNDEFEKFLRKNANDINHYEMLADLYDHNHAFGNSKYFRTEKVAVIKEYVKKLRKGKITVNADNLTACGNPYLLLLYSVGEYEEYDKTLQYEAGTIQCYTKRFDDGEYLAAFRNPHNSSNNICYFHNVYTEEMDKYFNFSKNIIAVNCIHTDVQARLNGADFDLTQWVS